MSRANKFVQSNIYDNWSTGSRKNADFNYLTDIPDEFDARRHFVNCGKVIGDVKDQGNCASSWVRYVNFILKNLIVFILINKILMDI